MQESKTKIFLGTQKIAISDFRFLSDVALIKEVGFSVMEYTTALHLAIFSLISTGLFSLGALIMYLIHRDTTHTYFLFMIIFLVPSVLCAVIGYQFVKYGRLKKAILLRAVRSRRL